ncbi:VOC family protein [Rhodoferax ferrireducens]|uniref:VOC family protein n=1 Tax=Rhodoferax ferrireducens TaxID=192843 RepID=UPI000E0CF7F9|nr:VOC family protein [Rhodoferax ferrireducens]
MVPFRYRKPGYVALNVTNVDASVGFYRDLVGLQLESQQGSDTAFLRCSEDHHNLVLYRSSAPGIKRMAFELESASDLEQAANYVDQMGWARHEVAADEASQLRQGRTFRFCIPESTLTFEFYAQMGRGNGDYVPSVSKIERLGHVVIRCAQRDAVLRTLTEKLNFRVSDHFGDQVSFLRCFPNPLHHTFGVSRGDVDGLHHVNFMVTDVDDVGRAMNRMRKAGVEVVYGPGRHDISNSIFIYFLDPDGLTVEYSFGMEEFPEVSPREARELPLRPEILDSWGGAPAPKFGKGGVIESAAF